MDGRIDRPSYIKFHDTIREVEACFIDSFLIGRDGLEGDVTIAIGLLLMMDHQVEDRTDSKRRIGLHEPPSPDGGCANIHVIGNVSSMDKSDDCRMDPRDDGDKVNIIGKHNNYLGKRMEGVIQCRQNGEIVGTVPGRNYEGSVLKYRSR